MDKLKEIKQELTDYLNSKLGGKGNWFFNPQTNCLGYSCTIAISHNEHQELVKVCLVLSHIHEILRK